MNSKLIKASLAGVAAIAVTAGGTTFAAWSDFADVENNSVEAGVLKMTLNANSQNPGDDLKFDNVALAPGSFFEKQVYVASNDSTSTPKARLFVDVPSVTGTEDGCSSNGETADDTGAEPCSGSNEGDLIDQADFKVVSYLPGPGNTCVYEYAPAGSVVQKETSYKLGAWPSQSRIELTANNTGLNAPSPAAPVYAAKTQLAPGEGLCVRLMLQLPNTAINGLSLGNAAQGDKANFNIHFDMEQSTFAPSS